MMSFLTNIYAGYALSGWNDFDGMYDMMGGYGIFGWFFMILFWILAILGIIYFLRLIAEKKETGTREKSALDILKERYAKGEINKEEFETKKKDLE